MDGIRFDPTRLVDIRGKQPVHLATITLEDDVGYAVIARSMLTHWRLIGVIDKCEPVAWVHIGNALIFFVYRPLFDVKGHLGVN